MNIICEYSTKSKRCMIRTSTFQSSLSYFIKLFEVAKADFPGLNTTNVEVEHYGGKVIKGTTGIGFNEPESIVPSKYLRIEMAHELL